MITYSVVLLCYRYNSGVGTCLVPLVRDQVEACSPQEAAYLIMEHHDHMSVDRVEVTSLKDGSVWRRDQVLYKDIYSVALWRTEKRGELPFFDSLLQANSPLLAVLWFMQSRRLTYIARASVRCPDGSTWRYSHLRRERDEVPQSTSSEGGLQ